MKNEVRVSLGVRSVERFHGLIGEIVFFKWDSLAVRSQLIRRFIQLLFFVSCKFAITRAQDWMTPFCCGILVDSLHGNGAFILSSVFVLVACVLSPKAKITIAVH